jgi:tRNA(Ile)-lysidine synthase
MTKQKQRAPDWAAAATKIAEALPRERLHPSVLAWAEDASARGRWGVAFSGGADSLALLLLLWAHWPSRRNRLRALHFNHRLRGRESRADEIFCRGVCRALGIEFVSASWREARADASEAEAREARHAFFAQHARVVWLGHQQDDIAETFFMRLARGSGTGGLAAPRPVQRLPGGRVHLRPLLTLAKRDILTALRRAGVSWREDSSNAGENYFRNRVRLRVVPAWQKASQRDALAGAARSRELLDEDDTALEAWLAELNPFVRKSVLQLDKLAGRPRAVFRRALHHWLLAQTGAGDLSRQGFEALLEAVVRGKPTRHSLGRTGFAVIHGGELSFDFYGKRPRKFQRSTN